MSAAIAASLTLTSCSDDKYISGQWLSGDSKIFLNDQSLADVDVTSRLTFTPDEKDGRQGVISIVSDVVVRDEISTLDSLDLKYEVTITGQTSISGTYAYEDDEDDEIIIHLDRSTLKTVVNPQAVTYGQNIVTDSLMPQVETLDRKQIATVYQAQIHRAILDDYAKYTKLSDVKISKSLMSCEIKDKDANERDFTFRRIEAAEKQ